MQYVLTSIKTSVESTVTKAGFIAIYNISNGFKMEIDEMRFPWVDKVVNMPALWGENGIETNWNVKFLNIKNKCKYRKFI